MMGAWAMLLVLGVAACGQTPDRTADISNSRCKMPSQTAVILERDGAILETWTLRQEEVASDALADPPIAGTEAEAAVWRNEHFNNELVFSGAVGSIERISCLDALLFARQASRFSQIDRPSEFLASVLKREKGSGTYLVVVFGAGPGVIPPKAVYGFEVVKRFLTEGWSYWYAIHSHTVQRNGDRLALGVPAPSTSDVQLYRMLAEKMGLDSLRVTNGFYTFSASVDELSAFRER